MLRKLNSILTTPLRRICQRRISSFDDDINILSDDIDQSYASDAIKSRLNYTFYNRTFAFVIDAPLFTTQKISMSVGKQKMGLLKSASSYFKNDTFFATALLPKLELTSSNYRSTTDFYSIGSYCVVDILDNNTITLKSLHKNRIKKVYPMELPKKDSNATDSVFNDMNIDREEYFYNLTKLNDPLNSNTHSTMDKSVPVTDDMEGSLIHVPDDILHFCESEPLELGAYNLLELNTRVKIDYLIEFHRKLIPFRNVDNLSFVVNYHDIEGFIDHLGILLADMKFFKYEELCALFMADDICDAVDVAFNLMKRYFVFANKMQDISKIAERNIQMKRNREYYGEIYSVVKNMAETDKKSSIKRIKQEFDTKSPADHIKEVFDENYKRLLDLDKHNPEFNILKSYCEWMACLPYGVRTTETFDLERAEAELNRQHYGLKDVKKRILEFLAVGKLNATLKGKILCLEGPAGVGKTSFAYAVANALGRNVARISLGGENDVSVLKGFRKTYVGARPGKIVSALKQCNSDNCVIIIDEIDKVGKGHMTGDPQATLLEILDPEQNNAFVDNYLDYAIDLSNVLFICTANNLGDISEPLLDRMDVVHLSSYTKHEKVEIYKRHLLPNTIRDTGLDNYKHMFEIEDEVLNRLIEGYCREAGIRSLQKHVNRLMERVAFEIIEIVESVNEQIKSEAVADTDADIEIKRTELTSAKKIIITTDNLHKYIGHPYFDKDSMYEQPHPGVAKGLAYNSFGGSVLFLEASLASMKKFSRGMKLTGSLGDVMKESMKIAYSYSRKYLAERGNRYLEEHQVHIHIPEGATPKDGPSAGVAITTALISLANNENVKNGFAMTGELSLKGKVLKIGGLKEKVLAARREGLMDVIVPKDNKDDAERLDQEITDGIRFHYVENFDDVYILLFPQLVK